MFPVLQGGRAHTDYITWQPSLCSLKSIGSGMRNATITTPTCSMTSVRTTDWQDDGRGFVVKAKSKSAYFDLNLVLIENLVTLRRAKVGYFTEKLEVCSLTDLSYLLTYDSCFCGAKLNFLWLAYFKLKSTCGFTSWTLLMWSCFSRKCLVCISLHPFL